MPSVRAPKSKQLKQAKIIQVKQPNKKCTCGACDPPKPKLPAGMRRIKVQQKIVTQGRSNTLIPVIMLSGKWLLKSGFAYQDYVIVIEKKGQLVITLDSCNLNLL